jgi:hypothetical protein
VSYALSVSSYASALAPTATPLGMTIGADGNVWVVGTDSSLPGAWGGCAWKITPAGAVTQYPCPSTWNCQPHSPVLDTTSGVIWASNFYFGGADYATISTAGVWTSQHATWATQPNTYVDVTLFSSDGYLYGWCDDVILGVGLIKVNPATVSVTFTSYPLDPGPTTWRLTGMSEDAGGNLWGYDGGVYSVKEVNKSGSVLNTYSVTTSAHPAAGFTRGLDGNFWLQGDRYSGGTAAWKVTPAGVVTSFSATWPNGVVASPGIAPMNDPNGGHMVAIYEDESGYDADYGGIVLVDSAGGVHRFNGAQCSLISASTSGFVLGTSSASTMYLLDTVRNFYVVTPTVATTIQIIMLP